ncbi:MAG: RDD family protein [Paracoccaceae bacterium]
MTLPDPIDEPALYEGVRSRRLAAFCLDLMVILVLLGGVAIIAVIVNVLTFGLALPFTVPAFAVIGLIYRTTMVMERSATLGMMAFGIELRDGEGVRLTAGLALVHAGLYTAALYMTPIQAISLLYCLFNPRKQMLHDVVAGTVMIRRPA